LVLALCFSLFPHSLYLCFLQFVWSVDVVRELLCKR
jgi:hypothetical protein